MPDARICDVVFIAIRNLSSQLAASMYERFTDPAKRVMYGANDEARRLNHEYIATEHMLLALIKEERGVAAKVLENLRVDQGQIRLAIEKLAQPGPEMFTMGKLPQTPRVKQVVEYATAEARDLNYPYVGDEHILLGLLREQEGVAAPVLMNHGLKLKEARQEVVKLAACGVKGELNRDEKYRELSPLLVDAAIATQPPLAPADTTPFRQLAAWFAEQCDGAWEHQHGIKIESCDNPGWWLTISVAQTRLAGATFTPQRISVDENDRPTSARWLCCHVIDDVFHGAGDPTRLEQIVNVFLTWANSQRPRNK